MREHSGAFYNSMSRWLIIQVLSNGCAFKSVSFRLPSPAMLIQNDPSVEELQGNMGREHRYITGQEGGPDEDHEGESLGGRSSSKRPSLRVQYTVVHNHNTGWGNDTSRIGRAGRAELHGHGRHPGCSTDRQNRTFGPPPISQILPFLPPNSGWRSDRDCRSKFNPTIFYSVSAPPTYSETSQV